LKQNFGPSSDDSNSIIVFDYRWMFKVEITKKAIGRTGRTDRCFIWFLVGGITGVV
jgi:hypothetical protein